MLGFQILENRCVQILNHHLTKVIFQYFPLFLCLTISTLFNFKRAIAGHLGAKQLNMKPAPVGLSMTKEYSRCGAKSRKSGGQETIQQILVTPIKILTPPSLTRASKHPGPCPLSTASAEHTRAVRKVQWRLGCRHVNTWSRLTGALSPAGYDI